MTLQYMANGTDDDIKHLSEETYSRRRCSPVLEGTPNPLLIQDEGVGVTRLQHPCQPSGDDIIPDPRQSELVQNIVVQVYPSCIKRQNRLQGGQELPEDQT